MHSHLVMAGVRTRRYFGVEGHIARGLGVAQNWTAEGVHSPHCADEGAEE